MSKKWLLWCGALLCIPAGCGICVLGGKLEQQWILWLGLIVIGCSGVLFAIGQEAGKKRKQELGLFKLLLLVSLADGEVTDDEASFLKQYAERLKISDDLRAKLLKETLKGNLKFEIVSTDKEKDINRLIDIMMVDGKIEEKELKIVKEIASQYKMSDRYVDEEIARRS